MRSVALALPSAPRVAGDIIARAGALLTASRGAANVLGLERLDYEARSAYWLRFLNGRWLIYWHERLIADFPAENAPLALDLLRQKQSESEPARGTKSIAYI